MGTEISHDACKLSRPPRLLKKESPVIEKKVQGENTFINSNERKNYGAQKRTRTPRSWKKMYKQEKNREKMKKKVDMEISRGVRKRIWILNFFFKKEVQLKKNSNSNESENHC